VTLLGSDTPLKFEQTSSSLTVTLPVANTTSRMPYGFRIDGMMPLGS
jgi:hypothetical protein